MDSKESNILSFVYIHVNGSYTTVIEGFGTTHIWVVYIVREYRTPTTYKVFFAMIINFYQTFREYTCYFIAPLSILPRSCTWFKQKYKQYTRLHHGLGVRASIHNMASPHYWRDTRALHWVSMPTCVLGGHGCDAIVHGWASVLCIPASNSKSESNFSDVANMLIKKRSGLKPVTVNDFLFVRSNQDLV
jgi:hypothetical protein